MPAVVVAALSARLLAQSAQRAGWEVLALDLFGDVDTRAAAQRWISLGDPDGLRIEGDRLLDALRTARDLSDCIGWIAGTGFEPQPQLLEQGAQILPLLGNGRSILDRVRDPRRFFATLDELGLAHPPTRFEAPADPRGWLVKDFASSGGWHVRRAGRAHGDAVGSSSAYFQRDITGHAMSLLFLADGRRAMPVAINALRVRAHGVRPYVYHGAIGPVTVRPPGVAEALGKAVDLLVGAFGLRGLGSLDLLLDGTTFSVLELNARPTATVALYDADVPDGLLRWHVAAWGGTLPGAPLPIDARRVRGEATVFAVGACMATPKHVERLLAMGCRDVPQPGTRIPAGAPLCSVAAHGYDAAAVEEQLAAQERTVLAMLRN